MMAMIGRKAVVRMIDLKVLRSNGRQWLGECFRLCRKPVIT